MSGMPPSAAGTARGGSPAYRWCFTVNNWTEEEYGLILSTCESSVKYLIIAKEVGERGTPHLQGFVNFKKKVRRSTLMKQPGFTRAHVEPARGTDHQNQAYCQKSGKYLEIGSPQSQGKSTGLSRACQILRESNGSLSAVASELPEVFVRHGRGLRDYVTTAGLVPVRNEKTEVLVLCGPPGVGKTRYAVAHSCGSVYWKPRGPWWDGYLGQGTVILDDFYGWLPFDELLRVMDRYPLKLPVKGGFVEFVSVKLIITSNKPPEEWYDRENIRGSIEALFRRINIYLEFNERGEWGEATPAFKINF
ncbi:replication associated protein [Banfec circovirus 1]|uniref:replication associated protein n=1 Tax=Banfec circovirus 1 TaxID=3038663 RepID=UPI004012C11C|nr:replication associated protein [Banfec circovirus 1]